MVSPTATCHSSTVPSVTDSPISGIVTSTAVASAMCSKCMYLGKPRFGHLDKLGQEIKPESLRLVLTVVVVSPLVR